MPTNPTERQEDRLIQPSKGATSYFPVPDIQGLVDRSTLGHPLGRDVL